MKDILSDSDIVEKNDGIHKVFEVLGKTFKRLDLAKKEVAKHNAKFQSNLSTEKVLKIIDEQIAATPQQKTESSPLLKIDI